MSDKKQDRKVRMSTASASDLIYGIRKSCVAKTLTEKNWQKKGLWRMSLAGPVYININYFRDGLISGDIYAYRVVFNLVDGANRKHLSAEDCDELADALALANGEKPHPVTSLTRAAQPAEIPPDLPPPVHFIMRPGLIKAAARWRS